MDYTFYLYFNSTANLKLGVKDKDKITICIYVGGSCSTLFISTCTIAVYIIDKCIFLLVWSQIGPHMHTERKC